MKEIADSRDKSLVDANGRFQTGFPDSSHPYFVRPDTTLMSNVLLCDDAWRKSLLTMMLACEMVNLEEGSDNKRIVATLVERKSNSCFFSLFHYPKKIIL